MKDKKRYFVYKLFISKSKMSTAHPAQKAIVSARGGDVMGGSGLWKRLEPLCTIILQAVQQHNADHCPPTARSQAESIQRRHQQYNDNRIHITPPWKKPSLKDGDYSTEPYFVQETAIPGNFHT